MDAHSRLLKHVAEATALGAGVPQAEHYFTLSESPFFVEKI